MPSKKILIVDDDILVQKILAKIVEGSGYHFEVCSSGEEAIQFLSEQPNEFDLVLMDVMMPGVSGTEAVKKIRLMPNGELLPIIMVTGNGDIDDIVEAFDCGADDYITKPVISREVVVRMKSLFRMQDLQRELYKKNEENRKELLAAQNVQKSLLPEKLSSDLNIKFSWIYQPCHYVGGDLIDCEQIDENSFSVLYCRYIRAWCRSCNVFVLGS